jgi:transposase
MSRYDLTDFEWCVIEPLLPNKPRGVPRVDDRRVLNGIFWVLRSGAPWRDLPERYGPRTTCYNRFVRWRRAGVWDRLMDAITVAHDGDIQMIDSTSVRVHQQAATAKRGVQITSRGGLTTKIHVVVDAQGLPIRLGLTAGQAHDGQIADTLLNHLGPHTIVLADKAYDADRIRELIQDQGATPNQPALETLLQQAPLPRAQPDRALLLEAEALPPCRYPLRQARRQLPRHDPTRLDAAVAQSL